MGISDAEGDWGNPLEARAKARPDGKLTDLLDDIVYQLPGCPDLAIRRELMRAWRLFAEKTGCWKEAVRVPLEAGRGVYPVVSAQGGVVRSVDSCMLEDWRGRRSPAPAWVGAARGPDGWFATVEPPQAQPPAPEGRRPVLVLFVTLVPERNSEDIPQALLDRYGADIAAGVVGRLAAQSGRAWANETVAAQNIVEWQNALHDAAIRAIAPNGEIDTRNYEGWA